MILRNLIVSLILVILIFLSGLGIGMSYQSKKVAPSQTQNQISSKSIELLTSHVISPMIARGKVIKIDDKDVTLNYQKDNRIIKISDTARVSLLVLSATQKKSYVNKQVTFEDIKMNDNVEVSVRVLPDGQIEGFNIVILPRPVAVTPIPAPVPVPVKK